MIVASVAVQKKRFAVQVYKIKEFKVRLKVALASFGDVNYHQQWLIRLEYTHPPTTFSTTALL